MVHSSKVVWRDLIHQISGADQIKKKKKEKEKGSKWRYDVWAFLLQGEMGVLYPRFHLSISLHYPWLLPSEFRETAQLIYLLFLAMFLAIYMRVDRFLHKGQTLQVTESGIHKIEGG